VLSRGKKDERRKEPEKRITMLKEIIRKKSQAKI